ncbi:MAG: APC family permease [Gemmatimonadales bacterium]
MTPAPDPRAADGQLVRAIGPRALAASAINLTIGGGIFVLPPVIAAQLGPAALVAYAVCGLAVALVLLCYAEAGSRVVSSGARARTWFWFGYAAAADAAIAVALLGMVERVLPALREPAVRVIALGVVLGGLALLNIRGVRQGARAVELLTLIKLAPLIALVVAGLFAVGAAPPPVELPGVEALGAASLTLFFAFTGPDAALMPSAEIVDPPRTVPRAIVLATLGVVALYGALHFVTQGLLGPDLARETSAPLAAAAGRLWGAAGGTLFVVAAAVSIFGAIAGDLLAAPRAVLASARQGGLPARFALIAVVIFALAATGTFQQLAVLASATLLVVYGATVAAAFELRRRDVRAGGAPFQTPGGPVVPIVAMAVVVWLLAQTTWREQAGVGLLLMVASVLYAVRRLRTRQAVAEESV